MKVNGSETKKQDSMDRPFEILHILSDSNRLQILRILAEQGELCARDVLAFFPITQPTLSHHMNILLDNKMIQARKSGRWVFYRISETCLDDLIHFFSSLKAKAEGSIDSKETRQSLYLIQSPNVADVSRKTLSVTAKRNIKISGQDVSEKNQSDDSDNGTEDTDAAPDVKKKKDKNEKEKKKDKKKKKNKKK